MHAAQAEGGAKFKGLGEGENLNQNLVNKRLFRLLSIDKAVKLIINRQRM